MTRPTLTIASRFRGPARSANGGYAAGLLADALLSHTGAHTATVTLRVPPPLDVPIEAVSFGAGVQLWHRAVLVATADAGELTADPPAWVPFEVAAEASTRFAGFTSHPFPSCFVCGPQRTDGLRLFPGTVDRRDRTVAAAWLPTRATADTAGSLGRAVTWAALDCPGGWSLDMPGRPMVLGTITARLDEVPQVGGRYVAVGYARELAGRKAFTSSALYSADGRLLAHAEAVWIAVDAAAFNALQR